MSKVRGRPCEPARLPVTPCKKGIRILKLVTILGSAVCAITSVSVPDLVLGCEPSNFHHPHCILSLLKPKTFFMYQQFNIQQFYVLSTHCIYVFCVDLRTNSDYFPIQH